MMFKMLNCIELNDRKVQMLVGSSAIDRLTLKMTSNYMIDDI